MANSDSVDGNGVILQTGDVVNIKARYIDDAGGVGMLRLQLLDVNSAVRTGAEFTDMINLDSQLVAKV